MSSPESGNADRTTSPLIDSPLQLAGLAAGIPILFLAGELGPDGVVVLLTFAFFLGPYVAIGFVPKRREPFRVGFATGYGLSMLAALAIFFFLRSLGAPVSAPQAPVIAYGAGLVLNFNLLIVASATWVRQREKIDNSATFSMFVAGLGYPFLAFLIVALIGSAVSR